MFAARENGYDVEQLRRALKAKACLNRRFVSFKIRIFEHFPGTQRVSTHGNGHHALYRFARAVGAGGADARRSVQPQYL